MDSSGCMGMVAVVAVSGSLAIVAVQIHKRLFSDFMKKVEAELGVVKLSRPKQSKKKKVRFAADVIEPSANNKEYRKRRCGHAADGIPGMATNV
ncbi:hypothetical protein KSP39_PZI009069 [Platanthera zijinensis]|uniref:Uncharacterized protein n=1 Tax=Platanthera zijinensis TaxID=2320716 RepID=A0AAP0G7D5_9ASPA